MVDRSCSPQHAALCNVIRAQDLPALSQALLALPPSELDQADERGITPLLWAVREGWPEAVEQLLALGADPNRCGSRIGYPLSESLSRAEYGIAARLLRSPTLQLAWQGFLATYDALLGGDLAALEFLLQHGFELGGPAPPEVGLVEAPDCASALLFCSISIGLPRQNVFERLIALGADANARCGGQTLAGSLCGKGDEYPGILRQLLEHGAQVDALDASGYAPLHYAAAQDHLESVRILLDFGATPALPAADGTYPLLWAASNGQGRVHELLLEQADRTPRTVDAPPPLPAPWSWSGGAACGALELCEKDGSWHGLAWAPDEESLLEELHRRFDSLRGSSTPCLIVRALQAPRAANPDPSLRPGQGGLFRVGQVVDLVYYAPLIARGISRPLSPSGNRFLLARAGKKEGKHEAVHGKRQASPVEISQVVTFYEGQLEAHAAVSCQQEEGLWKLLPTG